MDEITETNALNTLINSPDPNPNLNVSSVKAPIHSNHSNDHFKELDTNKDPISLSMSSNKPPKPLQPSPAITTSTTVQSNTVISSALPSNLSVELRKIQQSAGLIGANNNNTFIAKHIYANDKMQTGSGAHNARIPAPNVTVVDRNGENIRILKRVPDPSFGMHSYDTSTTFKSNFTQSTTNRTTTITFNTATANNIYDQHIRVLTPVEIMRTLPSLTDHEVNAVSGSSAEAKNRRATGSGSDTIDGVQTADVSTRKPADSANDRIDDNANGIDYDNNCNAVSDHDANSNSNSNSIDGNSNDSLNGIRRCTKIVEFTTKADDTMSIDIQTTNDPTITAKTAAIATQRNREQFEHSIVHQSNKQATVNAVKLSMVSGDNHPKKKEAHKTHTLSLFLRLFYSIKHTHTQYKTTFYQRKASSHFLHLCPTGK